MKARFITSALKDTDWPILKDDGGNTLREIAVVGRSNVGKSSLLNHLFNHKGLAHVSSRPGKTQLLNFFIVDNDFALVDCPGYGFAKVPKKLQQEWGKWVEQYLTTREELTLILFLLDIRRKPSFEDIMFFKWAEHYSKPIRIILTKIDKIKKNERKLYVEKIRKTLEAEGVHLDQPPLLYTIKNSEGRIVLTKLMQTQQKEKNGTSP